MRAWRAVGVAALLAAAWAAVVAASAHAPRPAPRVLIVCNRNSADSLAIARHYAAARRIPSDHRYALDLPSAERCSTEDYLRRLRQPLLARLRRTGLDVDYIVATKGVPLRVEGGRYDGLSVDGLIATMRMGELPPRSVSPYFGKRRHFGRRRYGFYLVTRLDGYTRADCLRLVDRSMAARRAKGPFLLHLGPGHENDGYRLVNAAMRRAHAQLEARGFAAVLSPGPEFAGSERPLMGYFSWGSNDAGYNREVYRSLRFVPGALAETAVSTSGRTFSNPDDPGQSLIADLVAQGVTGCKGYVTEPYVASIALPDILFGRYTRGYNLAESFAMASRYLRWKDVVIGDPLCAPYAHAR